jgi:hypothetical protein
MHSLLKLAVVVFVSSVAGAGAAMAQVSCSAGCNMIYQQGASQCQVYGAYPQQYAACIQAAQGYAAQCMQRCASGTLPNTNNPFCDTYPTAQGC